MAVSGQPIGAVKDIFEVFESPSSVMAKLAAGRREWSVDGVVEGKGEEGMASCTLHLAWRHPYVPSDLSSTNTV